MKKLKRNVAHDITDWRRDFSAKEVEACIKAAGGGKVYRPQIGDVVDSKIVVVGPTGMSDWLDEYAILIHDLPDDKDGLYWDGKDLFILDGKEKVRIQDHMDKVYEE